jgi:hypothetical protein
MARLKKSVAASSARKLAEITESVTDRSHMMTFLATIF